MDHVYGHNRPITKSKQIVPAVRSLPSQFYLIPPEFPTKSKLQPRLTLSHLFFFSWTPTPLQILVLEIRSNP
ncbi:hypothetical protein SLEP1_g56661 [Rubroshorea leprosula]|uniref:Uncharacterized protein n=1 Tax=Rubroshorea leprosula TaxID=152421 RepID=A0AAV5MJE6_9ROSI|nr:hypothetical protein SLEP1_g56661 [Rubroshorea leprosula]